MHKTSAVIEGSSVVFYMDHAVDMNSNDFYSCYMLIVQGIPPLCQIFPAIYVFL